jgi:hypothetical protein
VSVLLRDAFAGRERRYRHVVLLSASGHSFGARSLADRLRARKGVLQRDRSARDLKWDRARRHYNVTVLQDAHRHLTETIEPCA